MFRPYIKRLSILLKSLFAPKGVVGPHMSQNDWDEQFSNSKWQYLADDNQREHYDCIIDMYNKHAKDGTLLDIGCGVGLLYRYFNDRDAIGSDKFHGIDISTVAIAEAVKEYPGVDFQVVNYQHEEYPGRFDAVVFNETLYYFDHAIKTLEKCFAGNIAKGGVIIISMCDHERHDLIWQHIDRHYKVLDVRKSVNDEHISWTIKAICI